MARFYQTTQRNFVDDFIFQPNWELAGMALAKQDADVQQNLDTLELFRNLPIDFWKDADQDTVNNIRTEYESRADEIAKAMQKDLLSPKNRQLISSLRRDLEKDYESGRLRQIQDNAQAYRQFQENLSKITDPAQRQMYSRMAQDYIANAGGQGALNSIFTPDEMFDRRDILQEWVNSPGYKAMEADLQGAEVIEDNGRFLIKRGKEVKELSEDKLGQNFLAFINSAGLEGYGASMQKYGGQKWLNEDGSLSLEEDSYLGNLFKQAIPSLAYRQEKNSIDQSANPYGMAQFNANLQRSAEIDRERRAAERKAAENRVSGMLAGNVDALNNYMVSQSVRDYESDMVNDIISMAGISKQAAAGISSLNDLISFARSKGATKIANLAIEAKERGKERLKAGYGSLEAMGIPRKEIEAFHKQLNENFNNYAGDFRITLAGDYKGQNEQGHDMWTNVGQNHRNLKPDEFIGKKIRTPDGGIATITKVTPVKDSAIPIFLNHPYSSSRRRPLTDNEANARFRFHYENEDGETDYVEKTAFFHMQDGAGIHYK